MAAAAAAAAAEPALAVAAEPAFAAAPSAAATTAFPRAATTWEAASASLGPARCSARRTPRRPSRTEDWRAEARRHGVTVIGGRGRGHTPGGGGAGGGGGGGGGGALPHLDWSTGFDGRPAPVNPHNASDRAELEKWARDPATALGEMVPSLLLVAHPLDVLSVTDALEKVPKRPNLAFAIVCRPRLNAVLVEVLVGILLHVHLPQEIARHIRRVVRAIRASIKVSSSTRAHSALYHRPYKPPLRQRGLPLLINIKARGRRLYAMKPHAAAHHPLHPVLLCFPSSESGKRSSGS